MLRSNKLGGHKKRRKRPPGPGLIFREAEVCVPSTQRGSSPTKRKILVDCRPIEVFERAPEAPSFLPHCDNESCTCGVSYEKFRSGWSFAEAAEMVGARGKGGGEPTYRPSRAKILRMMARLKRDEWEAHQRACAAPREQQAPQSAEERAYWSSLPEDDFLSGLKKQRGRAPRGCAKTMSVQTILVECDEGESKKACAVRAKRWASSHRFKAPKADCTARFCRVRQVAPSAFCKGSLRTITLRPGVKAVVGRRSAA